MPLTQQHPFPTCQAVGTQTNHQDMAGNGVTTQPSRRMTAHRAGPAKAMGRMSHTRRVTTPLKELPRLVALSSRSTTR
jgi:hypothetical protein